MKSSQFLSISIYKTYIFQFKPKVPSKMTRFLKKLKTHFIKERRIFHIWAKNLYYTPKCPLKWVFSSHFKIYHFRHIWKNMSFDIWNSHVGNSTIFSFSLTSPKFSVIIHSYERVTIVLLQKKGSLNSLCTILRTAEFSPIYHICRIVINIALNNFKGS